MTAGLRAVGHRHSAGWRPRLAHSRNWEHVIAISNRANRRTRRISNTRVETSNVPRCDARATTRGHSPSRNIRGLPVVAD